MRSSTRVPFLVRQGIADLLGLPRHRVRVVCERVGGGFGGRQGFPGAAAGFEVIAPCRVAWINPVSPAVSIG